MKHVTFKNWYVFKKYNEDTAYINFMNRPFYMQLGIYIEYLREHNLIANAWHTGYFIHELKEDSSIHWHSEVDNLTPDSGDRYWKLAIEESFRLVSRYIEDKSNPF